MNGIELILQYLFQEHPSLLACVMLMAVLAKLVADVNQLKGMLLFHLGGFDKSGKPIAGNLKKHLHRLYDHQQWSQRQISTLGRHCKVELEPIPADARGSD